MADLSILPGELNLTIIRGDTTAFSYTITEDGSPAVLPTSGWVSQIRTVKGQSADAPLATITVDASDAGTGVFRLSIDAADTIDLPATCFWDIEHTPSERTWMGGKIRVKEQVTQ
jgi:hypothetical protein